MLVKDLARQAGLDRVGIARAAPASRADYYRAWLAAGYAGTMAYLGRNVRFREDPAALLPGARSIICVAAGYKRPEPPTPAPDDPPTGRVARYARGWDYHHVLRDKLNRLVAGLRSTLDEPFETRICVDTAPILERDLAAAAGLGWIGKNTLLIDARLGSYLLLGECLTTLELVPDEPQVDHCGTCTACLDACPTQAFPQPYVLDASRCISYLTIEHRGDIPPALRPRVGDWVFGCDICQEVCPHNRRAPDATDAELAADLVPGRLPLHELVALRSGQYRRLVRDTALRRATRNMLRRNAAIALENTQASSRKIP